MTQTPSRDWQKDMEWAQRRADADEYEGWTEPLIYWLQEAKVYKQSYEATLTYHTAEKSRADASEKQADEWRERTRQSNIDLEAAEARVKKLEAVIKAANDENERMLNGEGDEAYAEALSILYPDTPTPTSKEDLK